MWLDLKIQHDCERFINLSRTWYQKAYLASSSSTGRDLQQLCPLAGLEEGPTMQVSTQLQSITTFPADHFQSYLCGCFKTNGLRSTARTYGERCATSWTSPHCPLEAPSRSTHPTARARQGGAGRLWVCCWRSPSHSVRHRRRVQTTLTESPPHIVSCRSAHKLAWGFFLRVHTPKQLCQGTGDEIET